MLFGLCGIWLFSSRWCLVVEEASFSTKGQTSDGFEYNEHVKSNGSEDLVLGSLHSHGRVTLWAAMAQDLWGVQVGSKVDSLW